MARPIPTPCPQRGLTPATPSHNTCLKHTQSPAKQATPGERLAPKTEPGADRPPRLHGEQGLAAPVSPGPERRGCPQLPALSVTLGHPSVEEGQSQHPGDSQAEMQEQGAGEDTWAGGSRPKAGFLPELLNSPPATCLKASKGPEALTPCLPRSPDKPSGPSHGAGATELGRSQRAPFGGGGA